MLVGERDAGEVVRALAPWSYLYSRLAMDASRSVRAEASQVMAAAALAAGRGIAPDLRSLVGPWWLARHDAYGEAAAAARLGFQAAFPGPKEREALLYGRAEVRWGGWCRGAMGTAASAFSRPIPCVRSDLLRPSIHRNACIMHASGGWELASTRCAVMTFCVVVLKGAAALEQASLECCTLS